MYKLILILISALLIGCGRGNKTSSTKKEESENIIKELKVIKIIDPQKEFSHIRISQKRELLFATDNEKINIFDITNTPSLKPLSSLKILNGEFTINDIELSKEEDKIYVAGDVFALFEKTEKSKTNSLKFLEIIDIQNPSKPKILEKWIDEGKAKRALCFKNIIYLLGESKIDDQIKPSILAIDVQNPLNPIPLSRIETKGSIFDGDIHKESENIFIAEGKEGIESINFKDPSNPFISSSAPLNRSPYFIKINNDKAFTLNADSSISKIDISDPSNPKIIKTVKIPQINQIGNLKIADSNLFISALQSGLFVVDENLKLKALSKTKNPITDTAVKSGDRTVFAASQKGIYIIRY